MCSKCQINLTKFGKKDEGLNWYKVSKRDKFQNSLKLEGPKTYLTLFFKSLLIFFIFSFFYILKLLKKCIVRKTCQNLVVKLSLYIYNSTFMIVLI